MSDHYSTLGVDRDAVPAEIKKAWRRRSSKAHPDKGGTDAEMAAVNRAYEVLSDPGRRLQYDSTGVDAEAPSPDDAGVEMLLSLFKTVLDQDQRNPLRAVSQMLADHKREMQAMKGKLSDKRARLVKRTGKVRVKRGTNLMQLLIDQQLRELAASLLNIEQALAIGAKAGELLTAYEADEEPEPTPEAQRFVEAMREYMRPHGAPFRTDAL